VRDEPTVQAAKSLFHMGCSIACASMFHLVFHLHLWCSTLHTALSGRQRRVAQWAQLPRAPPPRLAVSSCATCCLLHSAYFIYSVKPDECVANSQSVAHVLSATPLCGCLCVSARVSC
jgi:hypothetical protein